MKALVLWCRWHDARLRLRGRDETAVWGELVFAEEVKPFRYELAANRLLVDGEEGRELDEQGVEKQLT